MRAGHKQINLFSLAIVVKASLSCQPHSIFPELLRLDALLAGWLFELRISSDPRSLLSVSDNGRVTLVVLFLGLIYLSLFDCNFADSPEPSYFETVSLFGEVLTSVLYPPCRPIDCIHCRV